MKRQILFTSILILFFTFNILSAQEQVWYAKGEKALNNKKYEEAINAFSEVIKINKKNPEAFYSRGLCHLFNDDPLAAIGDFSVAIELDSLWSDAYNNRGLCYGYIGELESSADDFKKAIELDSNFTKAFLNLGSAYLTMGKTDKSIEMLNKVVEKDSTNPESYFIRGSAYLFNKDFEKGKEDFSIAIDLGLKSNKAYFNRASCSFNLEKYNDAIEDLSKAIDLNPKDIEAYTNRSICYTKLGLKDKANNDKVKIYLITSGMDDVSSFEDILLKDVSFLNDQISSKFPQNWIVNSEKTDFGEIVIVTHDSVFSISDFYFIGVRMSFDSNMYEQYNLKSEDDLLGFWEYNSKENSKNYIEFQEYFRTNIEISGYKGILKEVGIKADEDNIPVKLYELVLVKNDKLFYSYLQCPAELFEKMKVLFKKIIENIKISD